MSQSEIARAIGIENRAQISAFENGTRDAPLDVLLEYARLINSCMDVIVDDRLNLSDHCPKK
jgi:transcriptional regulator with XRE-family HTH domain